MQNGRTGRRFDAAPAGITATCLGKDAEKHNTETADAAAAGSETAMHHYERLLGRMVDRLPGRLPNVIHWLRRPALRWVRLAAGVLFIAGAFLSILPLFGIWMLPLGLVLLADDIPPLRRVRDRIDVAGFVMVVGDEVELKCSGFVSKRVSPGLQCDLNELVAVLGWDRERDGDGVHDGSFSDGSIVELRAA